MTDLIAVRSEAIATEPIMPVTWQQALEVFLDSLNSPGTKRAYSTAVRSVFEWLGISRPDDVVPAQLVRYRAHLVDKANQGTLAPCTVSHRLSAIRSFWRFCRLTGISDMSQEAVRFALAQYSAKVSRPYEVLSNDEQEQLVSVLRTMSSQQRERDLALVTLMLGTGLRAAEVAKLRVSDLKRDGDGDTFVYVRQGKGRKDRLVPLSPSVYKCLCAWLGFTGRTAGRAEGEDSYVFYGMHGFDCAITTRRIQQIVDQAVRSAKITKDISPHSLRHTAAMAWLKDGAPLPVVQKLLGHSSVATTQRYVDHIETQELKRWARDVA